MSGVEELEDYICHWYAASGHERTTERYRLAAEMIKAEAEGRTEDWKQLERRLLICERADSWCWHGRGGRQPVELSKTEELEYKLQRIQDILNGDDDE